MMEFISDLWQDGKLPIIDGLVKADGSFYAIKVENCKPVDIDHEPTLCDLQRTDYSQEFSYVNVCASIDYLDGAYYCGDGSHGSDGWLLAMNSDNEVEWLFFYCGANPFEKLWAENNRIHALNNLNIEWIFPVDNPEKLCFIEHPL